MNWRASLFDRLAPNDLGLEEADREKLGRQGLLHLGLGLLSNGGGFGNALGAGLKSGLLAMNQGVDDAADRQYKKQVSAIRQFSDPSKSVFSVKVGDNGNIFNIYRDGRAEDTGVKADRQMWFRDHPGMAPELVGKDGVTRPVGQPAMPPAAPTRIGMEADIALANDLIAAGIPEGQVEAFLASRGGRAIQPHHQGMMGGAARPSEAQVAAERVAAEERAKLDVMPARNALEAQGAGQRAAAETEAKIGVQLGNAHAVSDADARAAAAKAKAEADAKAQAERDSVAAAKRVDADRTLSLLAEAENIIPFSTGSRFGSVIDQGASLIGESTPGAQAIARLQTIAGQLTSSMPRMQGPQSDRDVELYRQMAGDLANPSLPRETRMAALQTIRQLNQKYGSKPATADAPRSNRLKFNPATGRIE